MIQTLRKLAIAIQPFLALSHTEAQARADSAVVQGYIRAASGEPVGQAVIRIRGGREVRSLQDGFFALGVVGRGFVSIEVSRDLFLTLDTTIVTERDTVDLRIVLTPRRTIELAPVVVAAERPSGIPGFDQRRGEGFGKFITRSKMDSLGGGSLADALRRTATRLRLVRHCQGGMALASATPGGVSLSSRPHRDPLGTCQMPQECYAQLFVDGMRVYSMSLPGVPPRLDAFTLGSLEAVEYYAGGSQVPLQFGGTGASCGTLVLWTRRQ